VNGTYYLLGTTGSRGPYRRDDLLRLWEDGEISASEACVPTEGGDALTVADLLGDPITPGDDSEEPSSRPLLAGESLGPNRVPMVGDVVPVRESIDEGIDFSEVVYRGHPCLLAYPKSVALAVLLFSGGLTIASSTGRDLYWIIGLILALIVLLLVLLERSFQIYTVTGQRIELHTGILARSSKEVRIRDIRAININRSGLLGIFGVGRIEFSSAGSEEIEVAFDDVWGARRVKKIVRGLQDGT